MLWLYDGPTGTAAPHQRTFPWTLRQIRGDLFSLHDVDAENPANGDTLVFNSTRSLWEAKPPAGGSGVYVREGQLTLATNLADQYMELLSGLENHTLSYDISLWETGATEDQGGPLIRFRLAVRRNGTSSIYLDDLHYSVADFFTGIYTGWVGSSHKVSLRTGAGYNGRILHVRLESEQSDLSHITFGTGATTAAVSGNAAWRTWPSGYQKGEAITSGDVGGYWGTGQEGRIVQAVNDGTMKFGRFIEDSFRFDADGGTGAWMNFKANGRGHAEKYFVVEGTITSAADYDVAPYIVLADNSVVNFETAGSFENGYHTTAYATGGIPDTGPTFHTNHGTRFTYKLEGSYHAKANASLTFVIKGYRTSGNFWQLSWTGSYLSSNNTPMEFVGGCKCNTTQAIGGAGVQTYTAGGAPRSHSEGFLHARWETVA